MTHLSAELTGFIVWAGFGLLVLSGMVIGACLHHHWTKRKFARPQNQAPHNPQSGNVFFAMFAVVGMVGLVGASMMTIIKGPVASMQNVTKHTVAENHMIASTRLAIMSAAAIQPDNGDCDADGFVEPIPFRDAGALPHPIGGGLLPSNIGSALTDPWGSEYGYCVWDHGNQVLAMGCGGPSANRLAGAPNDTQLSIVVISAGKDKIFQTACNAYVDADSDNIPDTPLIVKAAGSDDIVLGHTYAEANTALAGLWSLKEGAPETAKIDKGIEVEGGGFFGGSLVLGGGLLLPDQTSSGACIEVNDQQLRRNTEETPPTLEICDWQGGAGDWQAISGGGGGSGGPSAAFRVHKGGADQPLEVASTWIKVTWPAEMFDTRNAFSDDRFEPTLPGTYLINLSVLCSVAGHTVNSCTTALRKNGAVYRQVYISGSDSNKVAEITEMIDMNGAGDYLDVWVQIVGTLPGRNVSGNIINTHFSGIAVNGGIGGDGSAATLEHVLALGNSANNQKITNLAAPTDDLDAANKLYVDMIVASMGSGSSTPNLSAVLATGNAADNRKITGLATPTVGTDATHKTYVDNALALKVSKAGDTMTGHLSVPVTPTVNAHASSKQYVDGKFGTLGNNKFCRSNGTQVICDQDMASGGGIVSGWPDIIRCNNGNGSILLLMISHISTIQNTTFYVNAYGGPNYIIFNNSTKSFHSTNISTGTDCQKSIAEFIASGQAKFL